MSDALKRMNAADVDQFNEYQERITELERALVEAGRRLAAKVHRVNGLFSENQEKMKRIAELEQALAEKERHNELLRDALLHGTLCLKPESESFSVYMEKMQAAVDGGALDKDGEK